MLKKIFTIMLVICIMLWSIYFWLDPFNKTLILPGVAIGIAILLFIYIKKEL